MNHPITSGSRSTPLGDVICTAAPSSSQNEQQIIANDEAKLESGDKDRVAQLHVGDGSQQPVVDAHATSISEDSRVSRLMLENEGATCSRPIKKRSHVVILPEKDQEEAACWDDTKMLPRLSLKFENERFTAFSKDSHRKKSCYYTPSRESVEFYARQRKSQSQVKGRCQLAEELGRMELTHQLVSSKFSRTVASYAASYAAYRRHSRPYRPPKRSVHYPDVGQLPLEKFLAETVIDSSSSGTSSSEDASEDDADSRDNSVAEAFLLGLL